MTTLIDARAALLRITNMINRADAAILSDYLDNQVPLNVENNNLMQRLALAEGFVATIRDQSAMAAARIIKPVVLPTGAGAPFGKAKLYAETIEELAPEPTCTRSWWKNLAVPYACDCLACRVRANA